MRWFTLDRLSPLPLIRQIYDEIDRLEKTEAKVRKYQRFQEVFGWFAVPAFVLLLLELALAHTVWRKLP